LQFVSGRESCFFAKFTHSLFEDFFFDGRKFFERWSYLFKKLHQTVERYQALVLKLKDIQLVAIMTALQFGKDFILPPPLV
jgi:hypothetical protein